MELPNGLGPIEFPVHNRDLLHPVDVPLGDGYALDPNYIEAPEGCCVSEVPLEGLEAKRCRSLKGGKECKGFRVSGSDYCQGHKRQIDAEPGQWL